ncbi:MAG TPA: glucose-6-phosphate dehydrogenase assembly protein OpcA, partial [Acidimicrobiales bacterium]|nr:glucose-6-phosphate dehydrogenase assembly protein OpcA [Acidimicrobiales bacterium]
DAELRLLGAEAGGRDVWFEDVELRVHGPATGHLDSLIVPFTLPDLPEVVWFVDGLPDEADPLLSAADALLVDARDLDTPQLPALVRLARQRCLVDLSWVRLRPWRTLMAGLFDGPDFRPFVRHVERAEVWGKAGPRHLLGGWLADRLDLPPPAVELAPSDHVGMRLHARAPGGAEATFEVVRHHARRVEARAAVRGGPTSEAMVSLPEATPAWGLADALSSLGPDPVYVSALRRAMPSA